MTDKTDDSNEKKYPTKEERALLWQEIARKDAEERAKGGVWSGVLEVTPERAAQLNDPNYVPPFLRPYRRPFRRLIRGLCLNLCLKLDRGFPLRTSFVKLFLRFDL